MKKIILLFSSLSLAFSLILTPLNLIDVRADDDYNTLAPMLQSDTDNDGIITTNELSTWYNGLAQTAQDAFDVTATTFFNLINGVTGTIQDIGTGISDFLSNPPDNIQVGLVNGDAQFEFNADFLNSYTNNVFNSYYVDGSGMVCYIGPSTNVANYYTPTNTPNLPAQPTSYAGASHRDGITWFSLYYESSKSPYLNNPSVALGVRDMRFMVYSGMYSSASEYYVTFVTYSYNGSQFNTYGNFKVWCTLDNFCGAPVFTSVAKGQAYYLGTSDMYGFPRTHTDPVPVNLTTFQQDPRTVNETFYNEYVTNLTTTNLPITDIDPMLKISIDTWLSTEHEIEPTEIIDYVRLIYLYVKDLQHSDDTTLLTEVDTLNTFVPGSYTKDAWYDTERDTGLAPVDTPFWEWLFTDNSIWIFTLAPIILATLSYVIMGKR